LSQLGDAKVHHFHETIRPYHYVFRFDITMDNAGRVRGRHCTGDLAGSICRFGDPEWS
jgi:hypothetical protein